MIEFEIQIQGRPVGSVTVSDIIHERIQKLREGYLKEESCADSVLFKAGVNVGGPISMRLNLGGPMYVSFAALSAGLNEIVFFLHVNGAKFRYDVTAMFN